MALPRGFGVEVLVGVLLAAFLVAVPVDVNLSYTLSDVCVFVVEALGVSEDVLDVLLEVDVLLVVEVLDGVEDFVVVEVVLVVVDVDLVPVGVIDVRFFTSVVVFVELRVVVVVVVLLFCVLVLLGVAPLVVFEVGVLVVVVAVALLGVPYNLE